MLFCKSGPSSCPKSTMTGSPLAFSVDVCPLPFSIHGRAQPLVILSLYDIIPILISEGFGFSLKLPLQFKNYSFSLLPGPVYLSRKCYSASA